MEAKPNTLQEAKRMAKEASELLKLQIITIRAGKLLADNILSSIIAKIVYTLEGDFFYGNPAWQEITGFSNKELEGKKLVSLIHPDDVEVTANAMGYAARGISPQYFVNRYKFADGKYHWTLWHPQKTANDVEYGLASMSLIHKVPEGLKAGFVERSRVDLGQITILPQ